jgi:hypothetical protein
MAEPGMSAILPGRRFRPWSCWSPYPAPRKRRVNWVLEGRSGVELELPLSRRHEPDVVPAFVAGESPPTYNLVEHDDKSSESSS